MCYIQCNYRTYRYAKCTSKVYIYNSFYNVDILLVNVMLLGGDLRRIRDAGAGPLPMIEEPLGPENGRKCDEISRFRLVF